MNQKNKSNSRNKQSDPDDIIVDDNCENIDGVIIERDRTNPIPIPNPEVDENQEELIIDELEVIETNNVDFACNPTQGCQTNTLSDCFNTQLECKNACQSIGANAGGFVSHETYNCGQEGCHFPRERKGECICYINATYNNDFDLFGDNNLTSDHALSLFRIDQAPKKKEMRKRN